MNPFHASIVTLLAASMTAGCGTVLESWQEVYFLADGDLSRDLSGAHDCDESSGGVLDSYIASNIQSPELHIVGIYEAVSSPPMEQLVGDATIRVDRSTASALVLSAYESTRWTVSLEAGSRVDQIIVNGYHHQELVIEPPDTNIEVLITSHEDNANRLGGGYSWPSESERNGECEDFYPAEVCELLGDDWRYGLQEEIDEIERLVENAETITDRGLTSFHGCYRMSEFTLKD